VFGLERLAAALEDTVARPVHAEAGPPRRVMLSDGRERGPWLGYVLGPDGSNCWLALGWNPGDQAAGVRASLLVYGDDHFRLGPIGAALGSPEFLAGVLLSVRYRADALPTEHSLVNDLHAMVVLRDLLVEDAPARS
jgi:hypothetical protein